MNHKEDFTVTSALGKQGGNKNCAGAISLLEYKTTRS